MIADLKEFDSDEPGSVAFWIKLDPNTMPTEYDQIFSWRMFTSPKKEWHVEDTKDLICSITVNHTPEKGVVGAVMIQFRNKWICGADDLRDGRWHHVTALFHRGYNGKAVLH